VVIDALGFLTVLGRAQRPTSATLRWFPVAGLLIGAAVGCLWWLTGQAWSAGVAAALAVLADLVLTGMLHLDGLADSADGLLPHLPRERRLLVMGEPGVGAFAVVAIAAVLLLRWSALASHAPDVLLVAALWCASRSLMAASVGSLPYARAEGGLVTTFEGQGDGWALGLLGGAGALVVAVAADGFGGAVAVVAAIAAGVGVLAFGRRQLGGYTGDVLGAAGVVAETVGLVVAAAHW
jgi:adenosylcobinamide-GDP ribazoletransferase